MKIRRLFLTNFRNIKKCILDTDSKQVVLTGENGQGKTNLLEAVYILCYGTSFRTKSLKDAVSYGQEFFYLSSDFTDCDGMTGMTEISFSQDNKSILVDGKTLKDRKELIYTIPCIVFSHDDIGFVRGEPEERRRFFDQTISMYNPVFFDDLRRYKNILRQRNTVLKEKRTELLDIYDLKLASCAIPLIKERKSVCDSFGPVFPEIFSRVSPDKNDVGIVYRPSWDENMTEQDIVSKLLSQRETDLKLLTTTSGPHRDRFVITDKNGNFATGASTGQMRLASVVMRCAQAEFFRKMTLKNPVFLIDDVLLELDPGKRARCIENLGEYSQAFFTFLPDEKYFGDLSVSSADRIVYNVTDGVFQKKI